MGFRFNDTGGGRKTRRPIELLMTYDAEHTEAPRCILVDDQTGEDTEVTLEQLQLHVRHENERLHAEDRFEEKAIVVKMAYSACPNLTIIDTPGARQGGVT